MRVAAVVVMGGTYYICEKIDSPIERGFEEFEIEPGRAVADLTVSGFSFSERR